MFNLSKSSWALTRLDLCFLIKSVSAATAYLQCFFRKVFYNVIRLVFYLSNHLFQRKKDIFTNSLLVNFLFVSKMRAYLYSLLFISTQIGDGSLFCMRMRNSPLWKIETICKCSCICYIEWKIEIEPVTVPNWHSAKRIKPEWSKVRKLY